MVRQVLGEARPWVIFLPEEDVRQRLIELITVPKRRLPW
jgi:hypothetical protein